MEFVDDGYSGTDWERPALNLLCEAVAAGHIDVVLVYDTDRLARNLGHQLALAESFEKAQVGLEFVTTEVQDSPEGRMFFQMKGVYADYERAKFLDRTRRGRLEKAKQGYVGGGRAPYGYRYLRKQPGHKGGSYVVYEPEAQIVRQIFAWLLEGYSARSIVVKLNQQGIPASLSPLGKIFPTATTQE
jgi:site-specific DNA recombinase